MADVEIKIPKEYFGKYVAIAFFGGKKIIASGRIPGAVYERARKKTKDPIIFFAPGPNTRYALAR